MNAKRQANDETTLHADSSFKDAADGKTSRLGFLSGAIEVPDDFDRLGEEEIERLFHGSDGDEGFDTEGSSATLNDKLSTSERVAICGRLTSCCPLFSAHRRRSRGRDRRDP